jgi:2-oxoglutarate dehydrogenase E2 component (dihydrolipoamide succinyltransferase)
MTHVMELRSRYKDRFEKEHGVKLGFMSFFVKAAIEALKKFPAVNATIDGTDVIYHEYYDVGVAVSTDRGLMVPIVRDADIKSFATIEKEIGDYAKKAREGSIAIEDLTGGTFTITNGGVFGSLLSTPDCKRPAKRHSGYAQDPGASGGGRRADCDPPDDVPGDQLRSPAHRWS